MNPHTHDFRDTVRAGEKTGDPFQSDRAFRKPPRIGLMIVQTIPLALVVMAFAVWASSGL
jgi:hypothetical protein